MNTEQLNEVIDTLKEHLGTEELLDSILRALNNDELTENLEYIARMWEIDL